MFFFSHNQLFGLIFSLIGERMVPYETSDMQRCVQPSFRARERPSILSALLGPRHLDPAHPYSRPPPPSSVAFALITFHFLKREYETLLCVNIHCFPCAGSQTRPPELTRARCRPLSVHRFSNATMPFRNVFKKCVRLVSSPHRARLLTSPPAAHQFGALPPAVGRAALPRPVRALELGPAPAVVAAQV